VSPPMTMLEFDPKQAIALAYCASAVPGSNLQVRQVDGWGLDVFAPDGMKRWLIEPGGEVLERSLNQFPARRPRTAGGRYRRMATPSLGEALSPA
jgi:hypothetical protein